MKHPFELPLFYDVIRTASKYIFKSEVVADVVGVAPPHSFYSILKWFRSPYPKVYEKPMCLIS